MSRKSTMPLRKGKTSRASATREAPAQAECAPYRRRNSARQLGQCLSSNAEGKLLWLQGRSQSLRQFLFCEDNRVCFHAAGFRGFFHQLRQVSFGDPVGPQTGDLECFA